MAAAGIGWDVHRFADDRPLVLGGVTIPHERGLMGHSDADVLVHAIIDALLGAAALGDIGEHYPDTDPAYAGADSLTLLADTTHMLHTRGFTIGNIDATVLMERPKLAPHRDEIRRRLAATLGVQVSQVSVKATRGEGLGFVGREEGVAALAIAAVEDRSGEWFTPPAVSWD
jgi:2-C-methyl-D-erythritol 2,4-cyclodiphosphate synthase